MILPVPPEQIREITQAVLKRREFQDDSTGAWIAHALDAAFKWLSRISVWAGRHPDSAKTLIYILGAVLIVLLAHIAYTVVSEFFSLRQRSTKLDLSGASLPALEGVADNWKDAFALARQSLQAGDLYRTMWITHRILLSVLDLREVVRFARWKTNSDYLRECKSDDSAAATLRAITEAYERVIYAHGDFDREQAARMLSQVETFAGETTR
jgi:hypothetical protein